MIWYSKWWRMRMEFLLAAGNVVCKMSFCNGEACYRNHFGNNYHTEYPLNYTDNM